MATTIQQSARYKYWRSDFTSFCSFCLSLVSARSNVRQVGVVGSHSLSDCDLKKCQKNWLDCWQRSDWIGSTLSAARRNNCIKSKRFLLIGQFVLVSPWWWLAWLRVGLQAGKIRFIACWWWPGGAGQGEVRGPTGLDWTGLPSV